MITTLQTQGLAGGFSVLRGNDSILASAEFVLVSMLSTETKATGEQSVIIPMQVGVARHEHGFDYWKRMNKCGAPIGWAVHFDVGFDNGARRQGSSTLKRAATANPGGSVEDATAQLTT